jgi:hypothetical protein
MINTANSDCDDIALKRRDFIVRSNAVIVNFNSAPRAAKAQVFVAKCCSFYGSQTWKLNSKHIEGIYVCWRKSVRRLLNVPHNTRSVLLAYLLQCKPFMLQLCTRFVKLVRTIQSSSNGKMKWLLDNRSSSGTIHANLEYIAHTMDVSVGDIIEGNVDFKFKEDESLRQRAEAIIDFMNCDDPVTAIIAQYLCTY